MKELSIEQKARAYDEALERARKIHKYSSDLAEIKRMEYIFSELHESDDDKILEKLINLVKKSHEQGGYALHKWEADEMLAWLEKQGQKPAEWHREDEQNLNACLGYIPDEFLRRWLTDIIYAKHDKSAWSEEDESMYVRTLGVLGKCYMGKLPTKVEEELKWFKSLKQKIGK